MARYKRENSTDPNQSGSKAADTWEEIVKINDDLRGIQDKVEEHLPKVR